MIVKNLILIFLILIFGIVLFLGDSSKGVTASYEFKEELILSQDPKIGTLTITNEGILPKRYNLNRIFACDENLKQKYIDINNKDSQSYYSYLEIPPKSTIELDINSYELLLFKDTENEITSPNYIKLYEVERNNYITSCRNVENQQSIATIKIIKNE